ncbi:hypothetical protein BH11PSE14_BH11PSE14_09160 [soil metagenome]
MSFCAELKQRKVFRVAVAYVVVAWVAIQVAATALPIFDAPIWVLRVMILLLGIGFPIALILAWAGELSPDGVKIEATRKRRHSTSARCWAWPKASNSSSAATVRHAKAWA